MSVRTRWRGRLVAAGAVLPVVVALAAAPGAASAGPAGPPGLLPRSPAISPHTSGDRGATNEILDAAAQYSAIRTSPGRLVSARAFEAARAQAALLAQSGGRWQEVTNQPYNSDALGYRDPIWSNSGGGAGLVAGRMTGLATDGPRIVYAAAADGGVWKSTDAGRNWLPVFDQQAKLTIGAVAVNPGDHSVWVGTGEANTNYEAFNGAGIYRSGDGGAHWQVVGNRLDQYLVSRLSFDGAGYVYAATSQGLLRRSVLDLTSPWTVVLKPDPNPTGSPYRTSFMTDVKVRPGTGGRVVLAALGWRGGTLPTDTSYNGWYLSADRAAHFSRLTLTGALAGASDIGRTTFAWSSDGRRLYALIESTVTLGLKGVYRSATGNPAGPWALVADATTLTTSGSALAMSGGTPGQQAWYNQDLAVDPHNAGHVYLLLEEVFETTDSGAHWATIGPYWNFPLPCWNVDPAKDTCPDTTHPDQHAIAISASGTVFVGNDGGVYSRPLGVHRVVRWHDLNATLHTLQYYYAGVGRVPGGFAVWGGLQDNGTSLLQPGMRQMVSPFGGDGGDVIVDPNNGNRAVNEYVYLSMASTTNGGRSDGHTLAYRTISPSCFNPIYQYKNCDPNPRFIAPFEADPTNVNHWVAGGQFVWDNGGKGWATTCSATACDWKAVHDTGGVISALAVSGSTTYAGWCAPGNNACGPGLTGFTSGIDTNYGGSWHRISSPVLPNRVPTDLLIDPANPAHVYVTYGAFNRRWIPDAGVGHVFESWNGGSSWTDLSGNLPDAPTNAVVNWRGHLVVGTDVGIFAFAGHGRWYRLGAGLPNASTNDLAVAPGGAYLLAATHGRGLWKITG